MIFAAEPSFSFGALLLFGIGLLLVAKLVRRFSLGGWGKAFIVLAMVGALFLVRMNQAKIHRMSQVRAETTQESVDPSSVDLEQAELQTLKAQHMAEFLSKQAATQIIDSSSMTQLWEQLNRPRINLAADGQGASASIGDGANRVELQAGSDGGAKLIVPISDKTPESLARSLARLERMVAQVSRVADQLSDAGTLIGKGMIALNDSIDSRHQSTATRVVAAEPPAAPAPPAPEAQMVASAEAKQVAAPARPATEQASPHVAHESSDVANEVNLSGEAARVPAAKPRPAWIDEPARRVGNTWRQVIVTEEFVTDEECYADADARLAAAVAEHMRHLVQGVMQSAKVNVPPLEQLGVGIDFVRREIAKDEYLETVQRSFGPMQKLYTLVEFSPSIDNELRQRWDEVRRQDRFAVVGAGAGSLLGLMGLVLGLLKVDTWTKGYYTKRLFLGVPAAIIGILGLLSLVAG